MHGRFVTYMPDWHAGMCLYVYHSNFAIKAKCILRKPHSCAELPCIYLEICADFKVFTYMQSELLNSTFDLKYLYKYVSL